MDMKFGESSYDGSTSQQLSYASLRGNSRVPFSHAKNNIVCQLTVGPLQDLEQLGRCRATNASFRYLVYFIFSNHRLQTRLRSVAASQVKKTEKVSGKGRYYYPLYEALS